VLPWSGAVVIGHYRREWSRTSNWGHAATRAVEVTLACDVGPPPSAAWCRIG